MPSENNQLFREFLLTQMNQRNMSGREFARFLGISSSSLNRFLDERNPTKPSIEALGQISATLGVAIDVLFAKVEPDIKFTTVYPDPEAIAIADRITKLSPDERQIIDDFIVSRLKRIDKSD